MQWKIFLSKWTRVAGLILIGGALAWALKLSVIIWTNGRIIDTGAAAILMTTGILMLMVGSTGIGCRLSQGGPLWLRLIAMLLSPALVFGSFILFPMITGPLFKNSSVWYAQQESPIALAVVVYLVIGYLLYRSSKPVAQYPMARMEAQ